MRGKNVIHNANGHITHDTCEVPDVSESVQRHVESAGNGGGRQRQNVHCRLQRADALLLTHAEALQGKIQAGMIQAGMIHAGMIQAGMIHAGMIQAGMS